MYNAQVDDGGEKAETSKIETDAPTTSSLVTGEPNTDAARQETVNEDCVIYYTNGDNNTMITTAMTQHVSAVSTQVSSSLVAYTMLSHVLGH